MSFSVAAHSVTTDRELTVRVLHSFGDAESLRSAWNDLVLRSGADLYQTYDWCRIWWQYYGTQRHLHLLLCFSGEELLGLVPAFIETLWLGPARVRVAKLIGSDSAIQLCNLPVLLDALPSVISRAIHHFFGKHRCDLLLFGPLSGPAAHLDEFLSAGELENELVDRVETLGDSCNTFFFFPNTFDEYLKALDKKPRSNIRRLSANLSRAHRVTFDIVSSPTKVLAEFEDFCLLHDAQWRTVGKLGHFGDWPHALDFNRDIVRTFGDQGLVRFFHIIADDQVVASQFALVFGGISYWRLPSRVCGPEWDKYGLGMLGLVNKIESAICEKVKTAEAGRGHYEYKLQFGGCEWPLRTLQFVRRGPGVSARVRFFRALAFLLNLIYYKVLFSRLAPRLPVLRRPLRQVWIRSTW